MLLSLDEAAIKFGKIATPYLCAVPHHKNMLVFGMVMMPSIVLQPLGLPHNHAHLASFSSKFSSTFLHHFF